MIEITYADGAQEKFERGDKAREFVQTQALNGYAVHIDLDDGPNSYELHDLLATDAHERGDTFIRHDGYERTSVLMKETAPGAFVVHPAATGGRYVYYRY